jgi:hypothetical protein
MTLLLIREIRENLVGFAEHNCYKQSMAGHHNKLHLLRLIKRFLNILRPSETFN